MPLLPFLHDFRLVACSLPLASLAAFVALDLAGRARGSPAPVAGHGWLGGAAVLGSAIWCLQVAGLLVATPLVAVGYTLAALLASWLAAVAFCAVALRWAGRNERRHAGAAAALVLGSGLCASQFLGMEALDVAPGLVWNGPLVALALVVATGTSAAAFATVSSQRRVDARHAWRHRAAAAVLTGLAIVGAQNAGRAAADFPERAIRGEGDALSAHTVGLLVAACALGLLMCAGFRKWLHASLEARTSALNAQLRDAHRQLRRRAAQDPVTGLPDRRLFEKRLAKALARLDQAKAQSRDGGKVVVLFVDLDGFKPVNDSLGHAVGDLVLREVAARLRSSVRAGDTVARIGGDEFVLLMACETALVDPVIAARRIVESVGATIRGGARAIQVSCSVGIATYPEHGPRERLVAHADAAMHEAKRAGGNTWAHFEARLESTPPRMLGLQNDLRSAIERGQLELHYQPKVDGRSGETHGVEALLRWGHPEHGTVSPVVFIPLAERFGLIGKLGHWVIDEACRQMAQWSREGVRMNVAINLSVHQLREADLVDRIAQALLRHGIDADQLLCEITESVAMGDVKATQAAFSGLAHIGVLLSIDDFGTGYSSLSYLRRLPARQLKIDRSFVMDLESSSDARAIVSAVVHLAHDLGLDVVAEGVETPGQRDVLVGLDCDELQGYLFAKPMPAGQVIGWIAARRDLAAAEAARVVAPRPGASIAKRPAGMASTLSH